MPKPSFYVINKKEYKVVRNFLKGVYPKVNLIARLQ